MSIMPGLPASRRTPRVRRRRLQACRLLPVLFAYASGQAWAVPTCTVAPSATLSFGSIVALASTGNISTNSGSSLWVNCTSDVATSPSLYSATARTLVSGANSLAFELSASSPGGVELATALPGTQLGIVRNGTNQTVTLYGRIVASNFKSLRSGLYTRVITLTVVY